ncbi:MAG: hypothetical protein LBD55_06305 [Treponema sp.]|jgi:ABC-type sugar transport system substrate-binding protein|nr:hypothetical protein [Treponema sp.]
MNSVRDRIDGFNQAVDREGLSAAYQRKTLRGDLPAALRLTEDLLQSNPKAAAIMGGNDPAAAWRVQKLRTAPRLPRADTSKTAPALIISH